MELYVILGGRIGYVFFIILILFKQSIYILKYGKEVCHFAGALIGLIICLIIFHTKKENIFELANLLAFCNPVGIFLEGQTYKR